MADAGRVIVLLKDGRILVVVVERDIEDIVKTRLTEFLQELGLADLPGPPQDERLPVRSLLPGCQFPHTIPLHADILA